MPQNTEQKPAPPEQSSPEMTLIAIVAFVICCAVAGIFCVRLFQQSKLEDCLMSGRHHCEEYDPDWKG